MDFDGPLPSVEEGPLLSDLSHHGISTNKESLLQATQEQLSMDSASATPLPTSSPSNGQLTPRLHINASSSQSPLSAQVSPNCGPLKPDRRSSTPLQPDRRSLSATSLNTSTRTATTRHTPSSAFTSSASITPTRTSSVATVKEMEHKPVVTAATFAQDYFRNELNAHDNVETAPKTVVIARDSCYGHRYSRPRTSKAALSTIVERPERLHACILGASTAYVRIGGRHAGGRFPPHSARDIPPPFKIQKTARSVPLNYSAVTQVHGPKWMEELQIMCDSAEGKLALNGKELARPIGYGRDEAGNPLPKLHEGDLYLCSESLDALQGCLGGVFDAVDTVFGHHNTNRAFVCIRPPGHHCSSNLPSGFCWLNNVHVGIAHAATTQGLTHAAIIDFDLHHGDGSQSITWNHNRRAAGNLSKNASPYTKTSIGYFSLHDINSYPCESGDEDKVKNASLCVENAHGQCIWNVHLEPWKSHSDFWKLYELRYSTLLEKTRAFLLHHTARLNRANNGTKPRAAIFISAGFDASEWEGAGMQRHQVNVPTDFYARFTSDIVKIAEEEGLGVEGRIISVLEGGYSDRALTTGVLSHLCGLTCESAQASLTSENVDASLASTMAKQMGILDSTTQSNDEARSVEQASRAEMSYDPGWWITSHLEALEALVNPDSPAQAKQKDRTGGNYSSPTQASNAKRTDLARERRSTSDDLEARNSAEPETTTSSPDIGWAVASFELARLLIPTDRQTLSYRHDELNMEATKVRRDRQSAIGVPSNGVPSLVDQRMQLRDRKAKPSIVKEAINGVSMANRRRTIAAAGDLPDPSSVQKGPNTAAVGIASGRPRRRSSAGSSILSAFESMDLNDGASQPPAANVAGSRRKVVAEQSDPKNSALPAKLAKVAVQRKAKQTNVAKVQPVKAKTIPRKAESAPKIFDPSIRDSTGQSPEGEENTLGQAQLSLHSNGSAHSVVKDENDLDTISLGMKKMKIHLKVPSPEENAAREKMASEEMGKQKKPRAPRKPAIPKATKATSMKKSAGLLDATACLISSTAETSTTSDHNTRSEPSSLTLPSAQPEQQPHSTQNMGQSASKVDPAPTAHIAHAEPPLNGAIPAPFPAPVEIEAPTWVDIDPANSRYASATSPVKPVQTLDSNAKPVHSSSSLLPEPQRNDLSEPSNSGISASAPTTVRKTRADLPQFTASSPIPFAKMDGNMPFPHLAKVAEFPNNSKSNDPAVTVSDAQEHHSGKENAATLPPVPTTDDTAEPTSLPTQPQTLSITTDEPSVWEVPETPRR